MKVLGLDLSNDSLMDIPERMAQMYVHEFFCGLNPDHFPQCTDIANAIDYDDANTILFYIVSNQLQKPFFWYATI